MPIGRYSVDKWLRRLLVSTTSSVIISFFRARRSLVHLGYIPTWERFLEFLANLLRLRKVNTQVSVHMSRGSSVKYLTVFCFIPCISAEHFKISQKITNRRMFMTCSRWRWNSCIHSFQVLIFERSIEGFFVNSRITQGNILLNGEIAKDKHWF